MNKRSLRKFSLWCLIFGVIVFIITYFTFHFVTDSGITLVFQQEAGKPFVTNMLGVLGILFVFLSIVSFISSFIFFDKE